MRNLREIKCFALDMDGTFYLGGQLLPGAVEFMRYLGNTGRRAIFVTNNSSRSASYYAEKLTKLGWPAKPEDVLTSGQAAASYLLTCKVKPRIFLLGTTDLRREMEASGLELTDTNPDFVVLAFDTSLSYDRLVKACDFIRQGLPFVATHPDINCPTETGFIPDCGAMTAMIQVSTGVSPKVIGKPNREMIEAMFGRINATRAETAMVGDRLYTDIATANNAGISGILVLSGETGREQAAASTVKPDYIFENLRELKQALVIADS